MEKHSNTFSNALIMAKPGRVRDGFYALLTSIQGINNVEQTDDAEIALEKLTGQTTLVLIDFSLVCIKLQNIIDQIKKASPRSKCLVLVDSILQQHVAKIAGADGVLLKGFKAESLTETVTHLISEQNSISSQGGNMILETRQLSKIYEAGQEQVHALRDADFQAEAGDFIVVNGPSGSGKTTFLNLVSLIDEPTSGEVLIEGQPVTRLSSSSLAEVRRDKIGLMFQSFNLIPVLSAYENVEYPLLLKGVPRAQRRDKVMQLLAAVDLEREAFRRPDQMSGGQKQRVALARTLVNDPILVLADEPTGNLDSTMGETVMALMKQLNEERKVTFIVVTHDPLVNHYAHRVVNIRDGQLSEQPLNQEASLRSSRKPVGVTQHSQIQPQLKEGLHVAPNSVA